MFDAEFSKHDLEMFLYRVRGEAEDEAGSQRTEAGSRRSVAGKASAVIDRRYRKQM